MGLEVVELVIAIEDRFRTNLLEHELEKITTIDELYQLLINRIQRDNGECCPTLSMFYAIRKILVKQYKINREDIRPTSKLNQLLPPSKRFSFWGTVKQNLAGQLPHLKRSNKLHWFGDTFPENLATVGSLVRECCLRTSITHEFQQGNESLLWKEVCRIVGEVASIEPDTLVSNANFFEDLEF